MTMSNPLPPPTTAPVLQDADISEPDESSYIDYDAFLAADFNPHAFANTLVLATNDTSDASSLDLLTPLSRVLFDVQEIDSHIHTLTSRHALPLLSHARAGVEAGSRVLDAVETHVETLSEGYRRLDRDVLARWADAEETRAAAENAWRTVRLIRAVGRCLVLGRQLETQLGERAAVVTANASGNANTAGGGGVIKRTGSPSLLSQKSSESSSSASASASPSGQGLAVKEDHRMFVPAAHTLLQLHRMFEPVDENDEGYGLSGVSVIRSLHSEFVVPAENMVRNTAQTILGTFDIVRSSPVNANANANAMSPSTPGSPAAPSSLPQSQVDEIKAQVISAVTTLYLLSPTPRNPLSPSPRQDQDQPFRPEYLLNALRSYIFTTISNAATILSRGLASLSVLDRALHETSARCQNIAALEAILRTIRPPDHPFLGNQQQQQQQQQQGSILAAILRTFDTTSLRSFFWRSLASSLASRVTEILSRGGASARALRVANRDRLAELVRGCVARGSRIPGDLGRELAGTEAETDGANWEREMTVMVRVIIGPLNRG